MSELLSKEILDLKIGFDYLLEAHTGESFEIKHKLLYLISKGGKTSPKFLIEILGIAKSNLAILCNSLQAEGLITKRKDEDNRKEIFYFITTKGELLLDLKLQNVEKTFTNIKNKEKLVKSAKDLTSLFD